jgi:hypothetical protein
LDARGIEGHPQPGRFRITAASGRKLLRHLESRLRQAARLPSLVPLLEKLGAFHAEVDDDVAIEVPTFLALVDEHEFSWGFDVIWLCTEIPKSGKPEHIRLTSDAPLGPEPPAGLADWMRGSSCCAGLGDGDGLNYATFDAALAALWRE